MKELISYYLQVFVLLRDFTIDITSCALTGFKNIELLARSDKKSLKECSLLLIAFDNVGPILTNYLFKILTIFLGSQELTLPEDISLVNTVCLPLPNILFKMDQVADMFPDTV